MEERGEGGERKTKRWGGKGRKGKGRIEGREGRREERIKERRMEGDRGREFRTTESKVLNQ